MREYALPGGAVSSVVRVGDTVRRWPGSRADFVHELLGFFQRAGWPGAPRFLGFDSQGRGIVSFVDGHVAWRPDASTRASVTGEASLVRVAELMREFHDLTAGSPLAGDREVVCHNDLAPKNTVYSGAGLRPWDPADLRRVPARRAGRDRGRDHVVAGPVLAGHRGRSKADSVRARTAGHGIYAERGRAAGPMIYAERGWVPRLGHHLSPR
jgi:prepilin-type processing-associated H-X9-DG protein